MPKVAAEAAAALLNSFKGVCDWKDEQNASNFDVREFPHGDTAVRGLATMQDISSGASIMTFPPRLRVTSEDMKDERFHGLREDPYEYNQNALWLAEKRAEHLRNGENSSKGQLLNAYWRDWFRELPSPEDYQMLGMPLSAPAEDIHKLEKLPEVNEISHWVLNKREQLQKAVDYYNAHREDHPEMSMDDATWGQTIVVTRSFLCDGTTMAPVGDMLSHSERGNVDFYCTQDGLLQFTATKNIKAGEELTTPYHKGQSAKDMFMQYGMFDGAKIDKWSAEDCAELKSAHFEQSDHPFLQNLSKLIDSSCPAPQPAPATPASEPSHGPEMEEPAEEPAAVAAAAVDAAATATSSASKASAVADAASVAVGSAELATAGPVVATVPMAALLAWARFESAPAAASTRQRWARPCRHSTYSTPPSNFL